MELKAGEKNTSKHIHMPSSPPKFERIILTYEDMHAVLVEKVEEVCLLRLLRRGEHIFWVEEGPDDASQLNTVAHLGVVVTRHLLDDDVHQ